MSEGPLRVARRTVRVLAAISVVLAGICLALALAWRREAAEATCFRDALATGDTPSVADTDCQR